MLKTSFHKIYERIKESQLVPYKAPEYQKVLSPSGTAPLGPSGLLRCSSAFDSPLVSNISAEKMMKLGKLTNTQL